MISSIIDEFGADLVLVNGKVVTMDQEGTIAEAIAVKGNRILKIGSNKEIEEISKTQVKRIDLRNKILLPGFIDSHEHIIRKGVRMDWVNLRSPPIETIDDIISSLTEKTKEKQKGEWIIGNWFDETKLLDGRWPNKFDLDNASEIHPIYIGRAGGHNAVVNSLALKFANLNKNTPQPEGGQIEKDDTGEPTGRLDEIAAMDLVRNCIPQPSPEETIRLLVDNWTTVEEEILSWGITSVHEAHIKSPEAQAYLELLSAEKIRLRVGLMLDGMSPYKGYATQDLTRQGLRTGFSWSDKLYVIGVKIGVDGAMGSLTASLREPYENDPENYGINRVTQEELTDETICLHKSKNRACIHAIGDWAIDIALNAIEDAINSSPWDDHRHRIEHAGYVRPDQLERISRLGVAVSASIGFCYPIGDSHISALGEKRLCGYYPMKSFQEYGIVSGGNSDGFGENWAITGISGCVNRSSSSGAYLCKAQAISTMDAIKTYTLNGAYLEGTEDDKGSLEPGKLADMVVLDQDILTIEPNKIINTKVLMTIIGGKVVYDRDS